MFQATNKLLKESINSDSHQFHQYQQNEQSPLILTVPTNSISKINSADALLFLIHLLNEANLEGDEVANKVCLYLSSAKSTSEAPCYGRIKFTNDSCMREFAGTLHEALSKITLSKSVHKSSVKTAKKDNNSCKNEEER